MEKEGRAGSFLLVLVQTIARDEQKVAEQKAAARALFGRPGFGLLHLKVGV